MSLTYSILVDKKCVVFLFYLKTVYLQSILVFFGIISKFARSMCLAAKWRWGRVSPSTSVSPANLYSTNFSTITITYHPGLVQRPVVAAVPKSPTAQIKKKCVLSREIIH
jgi:hypothetical protein